MALNKLISLELLGAFKTKLDALLKQKADQTAVDAVNTELGKKATTEALETAKTQITEDIATAKSEAISDADGKLATAKKALQGKIDGKLDSGATAVAANKLATARKIELIGGATGSATFDGSGDAQITVTVGNIQASQVKGVLSIDNIPASAVERVYVAENDTARLALTTEQVQNGDVVNVTETGLFYFVVDDTQLGGDTPANAFKEFTVGKAGSVDWENINKVPAYVKDYTSLIDAKGDKSVVEANKKAIETLNGNAETVGSVAKAVADAKKTLEGQISAKADSAKVSEVEGKVTANTQAIAKLNGGEDAEGSVAKAVKDAVELIKAGTTVAGKAKLADEATHATSADSATSATNATTAATAAQVANALTIAGSTFDGSKPVTVALTHANIEDFDTAVVAVDLTENTQLQAVKKDLADHIKAVESGTSVAVDNATIEYINGTDAEHKKLAVKAVPMAKVTGLQAALNDKLNSADVALASQEEIEALFKA